MWERETASLCKDQKPLASYICCPSSTWVFFFSRRPKFRALLCQKRCCRGIFHQIKSSHEKPTAFWWQTWIASRFVFVCFFFLFQSIQQTQPTCLLPYFSRNLPYFFLFFHHCCLLLTNCSLSTWRLAFFSFLFFSSNWSIHLHLNKSIVEPGIKAKTVQWWYNLLEAIVPMGRKQKTKKHFLFFFIFFIFLLLHKWATVFHVCFSHCAKCPEVLSPPGLWFTLIPSLHFPAPLGHLLCHIVPVSMRNSTSDWKH